MKFKRAYLEISNVCNLQCTFCPEVERDHEFMNVELFSQVLSQVKPLVDEVTLHVMGEPMAHPKFFEFLKVAHELGVPINLTTNGTLVSDRLLEDSSIRQINFSLQSFEANFPKAGIETYLEKIFSFTKRALSKNIYINFRIWNLNSLNETSKNISIFEKAAKYFEVPEIDLNQIDIRFRKNKKITDRLYFHFDSHFQWPNPADPIRSQTGFCYGLQSHFGILADGTVIPCCLDKEGRIPLGNCKDTSVEEILSSPRSLKIIAGFQSGKLVEDLCQKCTFISRFDSKARKLRPAPRPGVEFERPPLIDHPRP